MTVRQIVRRDSDVAQVLRKKCIDSTADDGHVQGIIDDLIDTMMANDVAIGLAAPQIGASIRVAVINLDKRDRSQLLVLINPIIRSESGKKVRKKESCMSLPGVRGEVERRHDVTVEFIDRDGVRQLLHASGFLARAIAHEVDHLGGTLYVDKMCHGAALEPVSFF